MEGGGGGGGGGRSGRLWVTSGADCSNVSRLGLVVKALGGKRKDAGSTPLFGLPFSSNIVMYGQEEGGERVLSVNLSVKACM